MSPDSDTNPELMIRLETIVLHDSREAANALLNDLARKVNELMPQRDKHLELAFAAGEFIDAHQYLKERNLTDKQQVDFLNPGQFSYDEEPEFSTEPVQVVDPLAEFRPIYHS